MLFVIILAKEAIVVKELKALCGDVTISQSRGKDEKENRGSPSISLVQWEELDLKHKDLV